MKTSHTILRDLVAGQSTLSAIAERMRQPESVLAAFLEDLHLDGHVESAPIGNPAIGRKLTVWRITQSGRDLLDSLTPAKPLQPACTP